eukprot:1497557-Prymnesium_polylepis.2
MNAPRSQPLPQPHQHQRRPLSEPCRSSSSTSLDAAPPLSEVSWRRAPPPLPRAVCLRLVPR